MDKLLGGLLRAGELECGVADAGSVPVAPYMAVADRLAEALVAREAAKQRAAVDAEPLRAILAGAPVPDEVEAAPPEGFAYYALHPLAYAEALAGMPRLPRSALVIGIRSIGTTLSAVVAARLRSLGIEAQRITVRPGGHPYNRKTGFRGDREAISQHLAQGSGFFVVDEGPGLSGSSFLSVAEALVERGAPPGGISLLCGHRPDFDALCADDGPRRARRFQWVPASSEARKPSGANFFIGGGRWRGRLFHDRRAWPASWIGLERLKYLSSEMSSPSSPAPRLFKFAGLGHYGQPILGREEAAAGAGYAPAPQAETEGFASYSWVAGRPMSPADLSGDVVARLANYCAFRAETFPQECSGLTALEEMAWHDLAAQGAAIPVRLRLERAVLADGRMQPYEWLLARDGRMLKTDSGSHGDDHFFPGVTDIAWDLAGAIVEWRMGAAEAEAFLECYRRACGDDAASRVIDFIAAYAGFRGAYCTMSAHALALHDTEEKTRLASAAAEYRAVLAGHRFHRACGR